MVLGVVLSRAQGKYFTYIIQWMIGGTRGGPNRARIIKALSENPRNANQLSQDLKLDYSTIRYHLEVLEKNGLVRSIGEDYGKMYFPSDKLLNNFEFFEEIWVKVGKKVKNDGAVEENNETE